MAPKDAEQKTSRRNHPISAAEAKENIDSLIYSLDRQLIFIFLDGIFVYSALDNHCS